MENIQIEGEKIYDLKLNGVQLVKVMNMLQKELEPFTEISDLSNTITSQVATQVKTTKTKK